MGDGGSGGDPENNGQNPATLLGTLLRLDVDRAPAGAPYAVPADNPYVGQETALDEVWAIGLRNPWRFSFDRLTGDLYVADVGQNQYEEVNFVPAGEGGGLNYGWKVMEGLHCFTSADCDQSGLLLPVVEYSHDEGGCSVTGGYVYRGNQFPALAGNYFFGDFCSGLVWGLHRDAAGWVRTQVARSEDNITSFGEGVDGELYLVTQQGNIYQIRP
jgi:glucose/arabinose dehydrogenase